MSEVTRILDSVRCGSDPKAAEELLPIVYDELRRLAAAKMALEPQGQTLQATALVHEAWIRLSGQRNQRYENRQCFFGAAAEVMRRILVDRARPGCAWQARMRMCSSPTARTSLQPRPRRCDGY